MKIGFSLGRCIRDVVDGKVLINDVAFIIAATSIHNINHLPNVIDNYREEYDYLLGRDRELCIEIATELWNTNRILQPRRQGIVRHAQPENSVWVDIFPTSLSENAAVKTAWDNYRLMLHMIENVDDETLEAFK